MLVRMWSNWNSHVLPAGMQNCTATLKNNLVVSYKGKHIPTYNQQLSFYVFTQEKWNPMFIYIKTCMQISPAALFVIAKK